MFARIGNLAMFCYYLERLLKIITNSPAKRAKEIPKSYLAKTMVLLSQLDEALDDCLNFINLFTGTADSGRNTCLSLY